VSGPVVEEKHCADARPVAPLVSGLCRPLAARRCRLEMARSARLSALDSIDEATFCR